jgi:hypothetical protein
VGLFNWWDQHQIGRQEQLTGEFYHPFSNTIRNSIRKKKIKPIQCISGLRVLRVEYVAT